jgi:predicted Rossmann-fold nucleotide-binding protein
MTSVSRAFAGVPDRVGLVVGIIPGDFKDGDYVAPEGYPNRWVELTIRTHLPLSGTSGTEAMSRNHLNVLSADVLVALPGGAGTASELQLARRYRRAVIAFVDDPTEIPGLPAGIPTTSNLAEVRTFVKSHLRSSD